MVVGDECREGRVDCECSMCFVLVVMLYPLKRLGGEGGRVGENISGGIAVHIAVPPFSPQRCGGSAFILLVFTGIHVTLREARPVGCSWRVVVSLCCVWLKGK